MVNELIEKDLRHIWHPCSQMKDFEDSPPLIVHEAKGVYLYTNQGPIIDAISSWWCKSLGHGHPAILSAINDQLQRFEHVIAANTTHHALAELGEKLAKLSKKQHVFFASDGSSAVEIALKLSLHAQQLLGQPQRKEFIALTGAYHGETLGTLGISDLGLYKQPYQGYGPHCHFINPIPLVSDKTDPLWQDVNHLWPETLAQINPLKDKIAAIIVEPLLQGAAGMLCYSADFLRRLATWAKENSIYFIADEIMTGLGRTGAWLACDHAEVNADLICLSKGLTAGSLPLSCVLIDESIYQLFYADYSLNKSFLHSHTFSGHALAVAAALATLNVLQEENINQKAQVLGKKMHQAMLNLERETGKLKNVRTLGAVVAADLLEIPGERVGKKLAKIALSQGALLKPIDKTLYWLPPLNSTENIIDQLEEITLNSIKICYS